MAERILVLGAGGFIGRHLVRALADDGHKVLAVSRRPAEFGADVESAVCEPRTADEFGRLLDCCNRVFHLASTSTPGSSAGNPLAEIDGNLRPTLALLEALQSRESTALIYLSSAGTLYGSTIAGMADESAPVVPRSYHGAGKAAAELFLAAWCRQNNGNATAIRPTNVYGPGQYERDGFGIIPTCFGKILRQEPLLVWGDGSAVRDYLYIDDFITLCRAVLATPTPGWSVVNASCGEGTSLNTLLTQIEGIAGKPLLRRYDSSRAVDIHRVVIDPTLAQKTYGWSAGTTLHAGLTRTWQWLATSRR